MSTIDGSTVHVEIAGRVVPGTVEETVWNPEFDDQAGDVLVDVHGSAWWVREDDLAE